MIRLSNFEYAIFGFVVVIALSTVVLSVAALAG